MTHVKIGHVDDALEKQIGEARVERIQMLFDALRVRVLLRRQLEPVLLDEIERLGHFCLVRFQWLIQ